MTPWQDWKCLNCDTVNGPRFEALCDVCAANGEYGEVVGLVRADAYRRAIGRLEEAEHLLSAALEPGALGEPVRCFSRGEMADIEMALVALRGQ